MSRDANRTIWKYELQVIDAQMVDMPRGAIVRSVQMQSGKIQAWVEVNSTLPLSPRAFYVYGTGHPFFTDFPQRYIDTVQDRGFVWHVYEGTVP